MHAKKMTYAKSILLYIFLYTSLYIPELRYIVYRKKNTFHYTGKKIYLVYMNLSLEGSGYIGLSSFL
jgi:hypothetical protein